MMHPFKKPTPKEWDAFIDAVGEYLAEPVFSPLMPPELALVVFHMSMQACGEGASPQAFANVLKGRQH